MIYQNISSSTKTFYGVKFKPNDIKEVPGYINDPGFMDVSWLKKEPPVAAETSELEMVKEPKKPEEPQKRGRKPSVEAVQASEVVDNSSEPDTSEIENIEQEELANGADSNQ